MSDLLVRQSDVRESKHATVQAISSTQTTPERTRLTLKSLKAQFPLLLGQTRHLAAESG
jgi:hypothetical protein